MTFRWVRSRGWITATCTCGAQLTSPNETALLHAQRRHRHRPLIPDAQTAGHRQQPNQEGNTMTKLGSKLPKDDDQNGLNALSRRLIANPEATHVIVAIVDCSKVETITDTDETEPTVRVLQVEAVNDADETDARKMLAAALQKRTGRSVLPFGDEKDTAT